MLASQRVTALPLPVFVSSISKVTLRALTIIGTTVAGRYARPCSDNTALTLRVPLVALPQSNPRAVPLHALTYEWVIPVNWRYNGTNIVSGSDKITDNQLFIIAWTCA